MKKIIINKFMSFKMKKSLSEMGFEILEMPECKKLSGSLKNHPDMCIFKCSDNSIICDRSIIEIFKNELVCVETDSFEDEINLYPKDIRYNAFMIGGVLFAKEQFVSPLIKNKANRVVELKQGYARCSTLLLNDEAVVTSDCNIAAACQSQGIRVLKIRQSYIKLDGFPYGFIGGAGARISRDTVAFFGCIKRHPDYESINNFFCENKMKFICLSDEPVEDFGGAFIL